MIKDILKIIGKSCLEKLLMGNFVIFMWWIAGVLVISASETPLVTTILALVFLGFLFAVVISWAMWLVLCLLLTVFYLIKAGIYRDKKYIVGIPNKILFLFVMIVL